MVFLIFGILMTVFGFRMYAYFNKNEDSINNKPGNLYGIAVMVIITGIILSIYSMLSLIR